MIKADDLKNYLGIDYSDNMIDANLTRSIETAVAIVKSAVADKLPEDPRVNELILIYASDSYENRGSSNTNITGATKKLVDMLELQLRLEVRRSAKI